MRKAIGVSALILALTCSAYGGDMPNGSPAPPPPASLTQEEPAADGDMPNGVTDNLTDTFLTVVGSVLALL